MKTAGNTVYAIDPTEPSRLSKRVLGLSGGEEDGRISSGLSHCLTSARSILRTDVMAGNRVVALLRLDETKRGEVVGRPV